MDGLFSEMVFRSMGPRVLKTNGSIFYVMELGSPTGHTNKDDVMHIAFKMQLSQKHFSSGPRAHHHHPTHPPRRWRKKTSEKANFTDALFFIISLIYRRSRLRVSIPNS